MRYRHITFLGDSFTWGEGLELYCNTPKWIAQREFKSNWQELIPLQDDEAVSFRETHRFSNIVTNHFNAKLYTNTNNGGSLQYVLMHVLPIYYNNYHIPIKTDVMVVQFSILDRDTIHFSKEKYGMCDCKLCIDWHKEYGNHIALSNVAPLILRSDLKRWYDGSSVLLDLKNYFEEEYNIILDGDAENIINQYLKLQHAIYSKNINHYIETYSKNLEERGSYTFFIDSWDPPTSDVLFENEYFTKNVIPLIGFDGNYYTQYSKWERTFPHKRISNEFPKTLNNHPTLLQHEYIGKSVIEFLEKKELKKQVKYI